MQNILLSTTWKTLLTTSLLSLALVGCKGAELVCNDGLDDNNDGLIDCEDAEACGADAFCEVAANETEGLITPESAFFDAENNIWFVSNIGVFGVADGTISQISGEDFTLLDDFITEIQLVDPKGLRIVNNSLFVTDISAVHEFNLEDGTIINTVDFAVVLKNDNLFLNDIDVDPETGDIFITDSAGDQILEIPNGDFKQAGVFLQDAALEAPNGILIDGENLLIASIGPGLDLTDFSTEDAGNILTVNIENKEIEVFTQERLGSLDGIERRGDDLLVSDFAGKKLFLVDQEGVATLILDGEGESKLEAAADIGFDAASDIIAIPNLNADGKVSFFGVDDLEGDD